MSYLTIKEYWENNWKASDIQNLANLKWLRSYLYRRIDDILKSRLKSSPKRTFLEVGCGSGRWLVYFNRVFGYKVYGIDYSKNVCEFAKKVVEFAGVKADIQCKDLFFFLDEDVQFDVVFSDGFLEHFEKPIEVIGAMNRLLKPGGILITTIPNLTGLHKLIIKLLGKSKRIFRHHRAISLQELRSIYYGFGYENISGICIGSIIPKVVVIPAVLRKFMVAILITFSYIGLFFEGRRVSSTYIVIGNKPMITTPYP